MFACVFGNGIPNSARTLPTFCASASQPERRKPIMDLPSVFWWDHHDGALPANLLPCQNGWYACDIGPIYEIFQASLLGCLDFLLPSSFLCTNSAVSSLPMSFSSACKACCQCTCHSSPVELWRLPQRQRSSQSHILHGSSFRVATVAAHQASCNMWPIVKVRML